ncbi:MAG TPA: rod shape-determining protein MreC [Acetobacteraceae bacterium]|nr:rod shape-determining protein MreC [Acetobacteraceae bacterium]
MIRLSISMREALEKLSLPVLMAAAIGLMLAGRVDERFTDRVRMALADALTPIYAGLTGPYARVRDAVGEIGYLWDLQAENGRLRAENAELRRWQAVAVALAAENARLKSQLHWIPDPAVPFITARAVADAGGLYDRAVLVAVTRGVGVHVGEIALDAHGLVGRVTEVGAESARVLLITDLNSRIPVRLMGTGANAIVAGTNGPDPELLYWPPGTTPTEGEQLVTSGVAGAFPPGLPVGVVHYGQGGTVEVIPMAKLDELCFLRLFDYELHGIVSPEAPKPARTAGTQSGDRHGG